MAYTEEKARELVIEAGLRLLETGLIARTWGNISARISDEEFIITPSGLAYETLLPEQLVRVKIEDCSYEGKVKPSSEKGVHAAAYQLQPETDFVIHTHQDYASCVGITGKDLSNLNDPVLGDVVPCAGYGLPSTKKLCKAVTEAIAMERDCKAVLMMRHGALCMGKTYEHAFEIAEQLEKVCKIMYDLVVDWTEPGEAFMGDEEFKKNSNHFILRESEKYGIRENHPAVLQVAWQKIKMRPYLDDLAQIAGPTIRWDFEVKKGLKNRNAVLVPSFGAICNGEDAEAVAMILRKGAMAELYAQAVGGCKPLSRLDANFLRQFYLRKYSKRKGKG